MVRLTITEARLTQTTRDNSMNKFLLKLASIFLTKTLLKSLIGSILDKLAEEVVESTDDSVGAVTLDQAIVILKDRVKIYIDTKL